MATLSSTKSSKHRPKRRKKKKTKHQRAWSEGVATTKYNFKQYKVPRKLGPVDMGRIKYKGTKYIDNDKHSFLTEKIHPHARSSSFTLRKKKNPVPKKPTVKQIGTPNSWKTPEYYDLESKRMSRNISRLDFLLDTKPIHTRDKTLDKLKNVKIQKGSFAMDVQKPFSWQPIDYELQVDKNNFLTEKFWFESSKIHIDIDENLSHLLLTLPPEKLMLIQDMPPPTGYESKLNYLNKLKTLVLEEARHNNNTYALNLLNVTMNTLEALSDNESEKSLSLDGSGHKKQTHEQHSKSLFNITLNALNDGSESDNDTVILVENDNYLNESKTDIDLLNVINYSHSNDENDSAENIHVNDSAHFQFGSQDFDEQMNDALAEILAPSPSPQPTDIEQDIDYNDDILDKQMEDALTEILAPSPSPQPQPQPQSQIVETTEKKLSRRDLLRTVQLNLNQSRKSIINKTDIMTSLAMENKDENSNENSNDSEDAWISDLEPSPEAEADLFIDIKNEITAQMIDATVKCDELKQMVGDIGNVNMNNIKNKKRKKRRRYNNNKRRYNNKIPSDFICSLTNDIINEAVMASDGRIYDKKAIEKWFKTNNVSPIDNKQMRHKNLMPFNELTNKINCWKIKNIKKKKRKRKRNKSKSNNIIIALSALQPSPELSPLSALSGNDSNENDTNNIINDIKLNENKCDSSDTS